MLAGNINCKFGVYWQICTFNYEIEKSRWILNEDKQKIEGLPAEDLLQYCRWYGRLMLIPGEKDQTLNEKYYDGV